MIAVDQKIAARKRLQEEKAKKSQEAAMLWRIELDEVRKQEEQEAADELKQTFEDPQNAPVETLIDDDESDDSEE